MSTRAAVDVAALPEVMLDSRALVWWGQVVMLVIEGTMFALSFASYFYLRTVPGPWPPPTVPTPRLTLPSIELAVLVVSIVPMYLADEAALHQRRSRVLWWLAAGALFGLAVIVLRWFELGSLPFKWYSHAYGSAVWLLIGLHTFHVVVSTVETIALVILFATARVEHKTYISARLDGLYWYWVVAWYVAVYLIVDVGPHIFR